MPLTREKLDHMAAHEYATGRLRVDPKAEPIVLQSRCHADAPAVWWLGPTGLVLTLACFSCLRTIADVSLARPLRAHPSCRECNDERVWVSYRHGSGRLLLECASCRREIATLAVVSDTN